MQEVERGLSFFAALAKVRAKPKNLTLVEKGRGEGIAKRGDAETTITVEFVKRWAYRPITDLMQEECAAAIKAIVKRGSPYQAHNAFCYLRRMINWAIGCGTYGVIASPVERIKPADLIGERNARERLHSHNELRAV